MQVIVAHAAWLPERRASLARLRERIYHPLRYGLKVLSSQYREHASVWAHRAWEYAAEWDDHSIILNDDVIPCDNFLEIIEAMIAAVPDECISLHTNAPGAAALQQQGHAWARCYHYTGPAVVLPPGAAEELLEYSASLPWSFVSRINEDNLAIHWAWERQRPFYCAIPAPVTHDTAVPSSLGYDHHPYRTPTVPVRVGDCNLTDPARWAPRWDTPWIENPWMSVDRMTYMRNVLRAGRKLCFICVEREGIAGNVRSDALICERCLAGIDGARRMACESG